MGNLPVSGLRSASVWDWDDTLLHPATIKVGSDQLLQTGGTHTLRHPQIRFVEQIQMAGLDLYPSFLRISF